MSSSVEVGAIAISIALRRRWRGPLAFDQPEVRDEVLRSLGTPILFVQGARDPLCPLDLLERLRGEMKARNFLHLVEDGDHSLRVPKREFQRRGETQDDVDQRIADDIAKFVERLP